jgi:hypothetical protein
MLLNFSFLIGDNGRSLQIGYLPFFIVPLGDIAHVVLDLTSLVEVLLLFISSFLSRDRLLL